MPYWERLKNYLRRCIRDRRTREYRAYTKILGLIVLAFFMLTNFRNKIFSSKPLYFGLGIIVIMAFIISIFTVRRIKYIEIQIAIVLIILVFQLMIISQHPYFVVFFFVILAWYSNIYFIKKEQHKFKVESIVIIALTVLIAEISYPLFTPRVDILSVSEPFRGLIYNEKSYAFQYYTFSVIPPLFYMHLLMPEPCRTLGLGGGIWFAKPIGNTLGVNVTFRNDRMDFCTDIKLFDFSKRIIKTTVISQQHLSYDVYHKNITILFWMFNNSADVRDFDISFSNSEKFPIFFQGNFSVIINDKSNLAYEKVNLLELILNNSDEDKCIEQFRFSDTDKAISGFKPVGYEIEKNRIVLIFPIDIRVPAESYVVHHIQFFPYNCNELLKRK